MGNVAVDEDNKYFTYFPMPYPDEILYSVLSRYHSWVASTSVKQTNFDLYGNGNSKSVYFPSSFEILASKLPPRTGITAEGMIYATTMFPWIRSFLVRDMSENILEAMKSKWNSSTDITTVFNVLAVGGNHLRFCEECIKEDEAQYGVVYWHRIHQLLGVFVCLKHKCVLMKTDYKFSDLTSRYLMLSNKTGGYPAQKISNMKPHLLYTSNCEWLLQNGHLLKSNVYEVGRYNNLLREFELLSRVNVLRTELVNNLINFYGKEFLIQIYNTQSKDAMFSLLSTEISKVLKKTAAFHSPVGHILLMCYLTGSVKDYFKAVL